MKQEARSIEKDVVNSTHSYTVKIEPINYLDETVFRCTILPFGSAPFSVVSTSGDITDGRQGTEIYVRRTSSGVWEDDIYGVTEKSQEIGRLIDSAYT